MGHISWYLALWVFDPVFCGVVKEMQGYSEFFSVYQS